jgi:RNA polymerase sigma-70 factor (ECF subfamily)
VQRDVDHGKSRRATETLTSAGSDQAATDRRDVRPVHDPTDVQLIHRLRAGDGDALAVLYDRYAATVTGLARSILRDSRLAEEATHDVFLSIWQNPHGYDASRGPFAGWLFRVARNRAIDLFRRRREQPFAATLANDEGETLDPTTFLVDDDPDPADQAVTALQREAVRRGLRELTADHQRLLELAYFNGMTQSEIATQLGRPLGTVKTQIRSAMKKLAEVLSDASTERAPSNVSHERGAHAFDATAPHLFGDLPGASNRT